MDDNWIEMFLNERGFLVSGTKGFAHRFGLSGPDKERPSIRFVASNPSGSRALFFVVLESISPDRAPRLVNALKSNPIYTGLNDILQPLYILITLEDGRFYLDEYMTPDELAQWFYQHEPALSNNIGTGKEINRSESQRKGDLFRRFTRKHLSRYCTTNDIDALRLTGSQPQQPLILELKKPNESIDGWKPYIDDCPNYMYLIALAQKRGVDFRVIAYNSDLSERVKLILNLKCDKPSRKATQIHYEWALVSPVEALGPVPNSLNPGVSSRKRQR